MAKRVYNKNRDASPVQLQPTKGIDVDAGELEIDNVPMTADAAELNKMDGMTATKEELAVLDNAPMAATIVVGAETGGNTINVAIQLKNANDVDLATRGTVEAYLSDDANGDSVAATAPSGGIAIGTDGLLLAQVTNKVFSLVSESDGDIDLNLVEAAGATWYLVLRLPNGKLVVSAAITFAA